VEVFGNVGKRLKIVMIADKAGPVAPGGIGTLEQLNNKRLLEWLRERAGSAQVVMSVCSGSAILAKAGLLDGKKATCNKRSFRLLTGPYKKVDWVKEARWVDEGNRVTSSGVSAGIDMALHMVDRLYGDELAQRIADGIEHEWHRDAHADPFARFAK
jgi:transcriptional regulator GlxA family with amidase domain